jgi:cholesterol oxidase
MHKQLAAAMGGKPLVPFVWTMLKTLITPHPLGGCRVGNTTDNGVVDHKGETFGYQNLFVADGSVIPKAIGLNPSKTIAALAERTAELMTQA